MSKTQLTLGSLCSGSGGFELAGVLAGMKPVWNSDIEPFAIRVTTKRLPDMERNVPSTWVASAGPPFVVP